MKKFLIVLFSLIITTLLFCGCKQDNFQDTDTYSEYSDDNFYDEEESTVRYELVDMDVFGLDVDRYEYNYIEFDYDNYTYYLENKDVSSGTTMHQVGTFSVDDDGYVEITNSQVPSMDYLLCRDEIIYFSGDFLYVEGNINGVDVSMTAEK